MSYSQAENQETRISDEMLAQMLQDEEDAEWANAHGGTRLGAAPKKGKKSFKPLANINYTVGRGATAAQLGMAQTDGLAAQLRNRRQQTQPAAVALHPDNFGPSLGAARGPSSWAPPMQDQHLSWAEKAQLGEQRQQKQLAQAQAQAQEQAAAQAQQRPNATASPAALALPPGNMPIKFATSAGKEYQVLINPSDTILQIKQRIESLHDIAVGKQRILHMGRELADTTDAKHAGFRAHQTLQLAIRTMPAAAPKAPPSAAAAAAASFAQEVWGSSRGGVGGSQRVAPPPTPTPQSSAQNSSSVPTLRLNLTMPGGSKAQVVGIPENTRVSELKRRIEEDHGVRATHVLLSFFGQTLPDSIMLKDCGIANGASLEIALRPPGMPADAFGGDFEDFPLPQSTLGEADEAAGSSVGASKGSKKKKKNPKSAANLEALDPLPQRSAANRADEDSLRPDGLPIPGASSSSNNNNNFNNNNHNNNNFNNNNAAHNQAPPAAANARAQRAADRANLVRQVFKLCDVDNSGRLNEKEMKLFAEGTGFEGEDSEWSEEYHRLCGDTNSHPAEGIDEETLAKLIDDQSDDGCYCSNEELQGVIKELEERRNTMPAQPKAGPTPGQTTRPRKELIARVFELCDRDADGFLNEADMLLFATESGFDGTREEWAEEFVCLCQDSGADPSSGLPMATFQRLVEDDSDQGQYCSDDELKTMIDALQKLPTPPLETRPAPPPTVERATPPLPSPPQALQAPSPVVAPLWELTREGLIDRLFDHLGGASTGFLNCDQTKPFAMHTGFEGPDEEWIAEFDELCRENGCSGTGISRSVFHRLVNDDSDNGIYCNDADIRSLVESLPRIVVVEQATAPATEAEAAEEAQEDRHAAAAAAAAAAAEEAAAYEEAQAIEEAAWPEVPVQAPIGAPPGLSPPLGFQPAPACQDAPELERPIVPPGSPPPPPPASSSSQAARSSRPPAPSENTSTGRQQQQPQQQQKQKRSQQQQLPEYSERDELIWEVFRACDWDRDHRLNESEMLWFAKLVGFDGSDAEWHDEFLMLLEEKSIKSRGIDYDTFSEIVNDDSTNGSYCTDEELKKMLPTLRGW